MDLLAFLPGLVLLLCVACLLTGVVLLPTHPGLLPRWRMAPWLGALGCFLLFVVFAPGRALAASGGEVVSLGWLTGYAVELVMGGVLLPVATIIFRRALRWLDRRLESMGIDLDDRAIRRLDAGLSRALSFGVEIALRQGKDLTQFSTRNEIVGAAARYIEPHFAETMGRLGVTPERLAELLTARLGEHAPLHGRPAVFDRGSSIAERLG